MAIAERMPDVGRRFYEKVLEKTISQLAAYLAARVEPDGLVIDDCAARGLAIHEDVPGDLFLPFVFQAAPAPSPERIDAVVESATRMFLANYRAK